MKLKHECMKEGCGEKAVVYFPTDKGNYYLCEECVLAGGGGRQPPQRRG
jgi:hypothetical protein